jgi:hypothetical protein
MADTSTVTWLLVVIAIATSLQTLMLMGAAVMMLRAYRNAVDQVRQLEAQVLPLLDKVEGALDAIQDTTQRLRAVDDNIRHTVAETKEVARRSLMRVKADWWPAIATAKAATAAIRAFRRRRDNVVRLRAVPARPTPALREDEESRFDYEGGTHVRS